MPLPNRLLILGVPKAGKTTLSKHLSAEGRRLIPTDYLTVGELVSWLDMPGPWIMEGVTLVRALMEWLDKHHFHPELRPADTIIWMPDPKITLTKGQQNMAAGLCTVWESVRLRCQFRGTKIESEEWVRGVGLAADGGEFVK